MLFALAKIVSGIKLVGCVLDEALYAKTECFENTILQLFAYSNGKFGASLDRSCEQRFPPVDRTQTYWAEK